jgi:hypothetical protein
MNGMKPVSLYPMASSSQGVMLRAMERGASLMKNSIVPLPLIEGFSSGSSRTPVTSSVHDIALFIGVEQRLHIIQISGFTFEEIHILDGRGRQDLFWFSFIEIIPQSLRYFDWAELFIEEAAERIRIGFILGCG